MIVAVASIVGIAAPAAGSPEEDKRRELLEQLGLDGTKRKPKVEVETPPDDEPDEPDEPDGAPPGSPDGPTPSEPTEPATPNPAPTITYTGRIHAVMQSTCASCHKSGGAAGGTRLVLSGNVGHDYRVVQRLVDVKSPRSSLLVKKALGKAHGGGKTISASGSKHKLLLAWIEGGAPRGGGETKSPAPTPVPVVEAPAKTTEPKPAAPKPKSTKPKSTKPKSTKPKTAEPKNAEPESTEPEPQSEQIPSPTHAEAPTAPAATVAAPPVLAFAPAIHERLRAKCDSCHGAGAIASRGAFVLTGDAEADYGKTVALVDRRAPASSRLLTKAKGVEHGGGPVIRERSNDYREILAWIEGGVVGPHAPVPADAAATDAAATDAAATDAPVVDATTGASPPPSSGERLGDGTPLGPTPSRLPLQLPGSLRLNGKLDFSYERRNWKGEPFGPGTNAFQTYHHFLFLSRSGAADPFGFNVELITQAFYEFNARVAPKGGRADFLFKAGKIMVPFGSEPLFHKSYGGRSGFDQEILPFVWAQPGVAATAHVRAGPVSLSNDTYAIQGYGLRAADAVINLQSDVSTFDDFRIAFGDRAGLSWKPLTVWYSFQVNGLGFDRRLFMQAVDVEVWRPHDVPVLEKMVLGFGALRADVSGGGRGNDYYHFGSYASLGYYPLDFLYLQYRAGLRTTDNRRGLYYDDTRADERDRGSHNISVLGRYKGFYGGFQIFWNLEKANEQDDDYLRLTVGYEF